MITKMRMLALTGLGALMAVTTPALADPTLPEPSATQSSNAMPAPIAREKRYCILETPTGTRIARKTCRTRDEWLQLEFDPLAPN